jgi:hypothetical protein
VTTACGGKSQIPSTKFQIKQTESTKSQNAEVPGQTMRRFLTNRRLRVGVLVAVACLAGLNLWRTHADQDASRAIEVPGIVFEDKMFGGRYNSLSILKGPLADDWPAATEKLGIVHSLHVDNELVTEDEIIRFLARHPELRDLSIEPVRITEKGAKQIRHCRALRSVTLSGRTKRRADRVAVDELIEDRPDLTVYGYHDIIW